MTDETPPAPTIHIVRGHPTAAEVAALTAVLATICRPADADTGGADRARGWSSRHRSLNPGAIRGAGWGRR